MNQYEFSNVYTSTALEITSVVKASPAKLLGFVAENTDVSAAWVQVHDATAQPSGGAVPVLSLKVPAGSQVSFDPSAFRCLQLKNGIVISLSTTGPTFSASTAKMFTTAFWI